MEAVPARTASANGLMHVKECVTVRQFHDNVPQIQLMHCLIVNIRAHTLRDVEPIVLHFRRLSEMFLFIADIVLGASHYPGILNTLDRGSNQSTRQVWVR